MKLFCKDEPDIVSNSSALNKNEPIKFDKNSKFTVNPTAAEPIKITDTYGMELSYSSLEANEKENVLSELLFQSALQNIAQQQIVIFN